MQKVYNGSMEHLLSVPEAAKLLSISKTNLWKLIHKEAITHIRIGSRVFFKESLLEEWLKERTIPGRGVKETR